jgi:hypothetical protein
MGKGTRFGGCCPIVNLYYLVEERPFQGRVSGSISVGLQPQWSPIYGFVGSTRGADGLHRPFVGSRPLRVRLRCLRMTADEGDAEEFDFLERCFLGHYLLELVIF